MENADNHIAVKQACAAIGQARLMMTYQKIFAEYNQVTAQILMTKNTIVDNLNRYNAHNTFSELLKMGVIPIVNENDTYQPSWPRSLMRIYSFCYLMWTACIRMIPAKTKRPDL